MDLKLKLNYHQLLTAIKELPLKDFLKLKHELAQTEPEHEGKNELHTLLLSGPVMSEEQYQQFKANRNKLNQWKKK